MEFRVVLLIYILQFHLTFSYSAIEKLPSYYFSPDQEGLPPSEVCHYLGYNPNPHDSCSPIYFDCRLSSDGESWNETVKHCDPGLYFDPQHLVCTTPDKVKDCHVDSLGCAKQHISVDAGTLVCPGDHQKSGILETLGVKVTPGEMCRLECNYGLISSGPTTTTCTLDGWTIATMECVRAVAVILGGINSDGNLGDVEVYHPDVGYCGSLPPLPFANNRMIAEWVNGRLIVCGGRLVSGTKDICWTYQPSGNNWYQDSKMTQTRRDCGSVAMDDDLWILGGWQGMDTSEVLDKDEITWQSGPKLPQSRKDQCTMRIGRTEFLMLGGQSNDVYINQVSIFSTENQSWRWQGKINELRVNHACGRMEVNNQTKVMVAGGFGGVPGSIASRRNTAELFDPLLGVSIKLSTMHEKRDETAMAVVDGAPIIFGGYTGDKSLESVERYNVKENVWEVLPAMVKPRRHHAAVSVPKTLVPFCNIPSQ